MKIKKFISLVGVFGLTLSCGTEKFKEQLAIGGSTTAVTIIDEAILKFREDNREIKVSYDAQGSTVGINGLFDSIYGIAISSRDLKNEELGRGARAITFARDAIVFVVNPSVNISNISKENLANILNGTILNWRELDSEEGKINIINRDSASGTYDAVRDIVLSSEEFRKDAIVVSSNGEVIEKVSQTENSIGYIGIGYVEHAIEKGLTVLSINSIIPSIQTVLDGKYEVVRPLIAVTDREPKESERDFIQFLLSDEIQDIIEEKGFVRFK